MMGINSPGARFSRSASRNWGADRISDVAMASLTIIDELLSILFYFRKWRAASALSKPFLIYLSHRDENAIDKLPGLHISCHMVLELFEQCSLRFSLSIHHPDVAEKITERFATEILFGILPLFCVIFPRLVRRATDDFGFQNVRRRQIQPSAI